MNSVYRQILLDRCKYHASYTIPFSSIKESLNIDAYLDAVADNFICTITWQVIGKQGVLIDESSPVTWWDAVKDRWFPEWLKKYYPVNMRRISINKATTFPTITLPEKYGQPIVIVSNSSYDFIDRGTSD
jgi:hypothetical protein